MKWIERFKEKVSQTTFSPSSPRARSFEDGNFNRPRDELEQDFRSAWEDFRSSTSEKEKEKDLEVAVSLFCRIARQNSDPARLALSLVDVRSYAFVVARALVTEIQKLRRNAPNGQLQLDGILGFFTGPQAEGKAKTGPDLLFALECLVSPELDVQPLIDAGLFPSLISVLHCLISSSISPSEQTIPVDNVECKDPSNTSTVEDERLERGDTSPTASSEVVDTGTEEVSALSGLNPAETVSINESPPGDSGDVILEEPSLAATNEIEFEGISLNEELANKFVKIVRAKVSVEERRAVVENGVIHILKAMARHAGAAQSLTEDDSLQSLFHMISTGIPTGKEGVPEIADVKSSSRQHLAELYRHVIQILEASLMSDNGSTAQYIETHQLIGVLLSPVINFLCDGSGDASYTVGVVSLILSCVQLSSRPESRGVRLKDSFRKGKGYAYLVQLALKLASPERTEGDSESPPINDHSSPTDTYGAGSESSETLSPLLIRLLDLMVNFAQTGSRVPHRSLSGIGNRSGRLASGKPVRTLFEGIGSTAASDSREPDLEGKIADIEIVQTFQDVFLKTGNLLLQLEILDRLLRLFASHPDNYVLVQELRTVPLFLQNMGKYSLLLQERLLKVLEYAVTVVNCVPEQELLSLCYLLQQPYASPLRKTVLSFFEKLLSFDRKYKKVLREAGLLDLLLDDVRRCGLSEDTLLTTAPERLVKSIPEELHIFEDMATVGLAWDCLVSLLKKSDGNQNVFRKANGVAHILPLIAFPVHRTGALRVLSCLVCEDVNQAHANELKSLLTIANNGIAHGRNGSAIVLDTETKEDILWAIWRILGANSTVRDVFGDGNGFGLLLSVLEGMQIRCDIVDHGLIDYDITPGQDLNDRMKILDALLHVVTVAAADSPMNRNKLHECISSQTFKRLLQKSGLLCPEFEQRVAERCFDVALERLHSLSHTGSGGPVLSHGDGAKSFRNQVAEGGLHVNPGHTAQVDVYNGGAIEVVLFFLLQFSVKSQLRILIQVERLVSDSPWNQNALTAAGCVGAVIEAMKSMLQVPSRLLSYALKIVETLGSFRLSSTEMQSLGRIIWLNRDMTGGQMGQRLLQMVERMSQSSPFSSASLSFSSFIEFRMSRMGHACLRTPLGDRTWPPAAGYSFVCWARFEKLSAQSGPSSSGSEASKELHRTRSGSLGSVLRIFTVGTAEDKSSVCAELFLSDSGVLTLATSPTSYLCFKGVRLEEGIWYHLTIVHNKPNALAGLFQSSVAYLYLDGSLRHTGKLGYSASPVGKSLQVTIGTPSSLSDVSPVTWQLGSCYLFEEVLPAPAIFFMYVLGRGYRGLFQDTDMLRFIPYEACGGGNLMVLESLDTELLATLKAEGVSQNAGEFLSEGSGVTWDLEKLARFWAQLCGRHLIFAYDGSRTEGAVPAGVSSTVNLVDPMSAAASVLGGLPRLARIYGDVHICTPCNIADSMRRVGGVAVVLAMIEAADSSETLHFALSVLVSMLQSNPRNARDMQACRGYHLLALFLHRRMAFFESRDLDFLFRIASCEASFVQKPPQTTIPASEPRGHGHSRSLSSGLDTALNLFGFASRVPDDQASNYGSTVDYQESLCGDESIAGVSDIEGFDLPREDIDCIVLANPEMMEHVLLDWTLWVAAPIGVQLGLLAFIERLVSMHRYRLHNLTVLRKLNLVQHLLVTLQRGDVEIVVLEKLVVLLGIILEDGFLSSELKYVADFVVMTFDPPHVVKGVSEINRESMGTQVIVRNMLLEMLIELQMTISADDTLDAWHKIVSSKLITFLLDEAVHPTSMKWVMTLLGACLKPSPAFAARFKNSGGFQALARVLPSFYDSPEVYYILFCLIFGKSVYPRQPEVRLLDFHALLPEDGNKAELFFTDLLESVISMAKAAFVRMIAQSESAQNSGDFSGFNISLDADQDGGETLQGEALLHKTYAARLMGGEQAAPGMVASLLRFMVDLAKMCKPFSMACRRFDFLESCVGLYFSCIRSSAAIQGAHDAECEMKDEVMEEDFSNLDVAPAAKVSELGVGTEVPIEVITRSSFKSSSKSDDKFLDTGISSISEGEALTVELATSPTMSDMSKVSLLTPKPMTTFVAPRLTQPLPLDLSETRQSMTPPPTPPRSSRDRIRHLSFSALSTFSGNISEVDFNFSDFGPSSATSVTPSETSYAAITPQLLLQIEAAGAGGGPCAASASAILDFIAEVLAEALLEQVKSTTIVESVLEAVPMYVNADAALIFQGLVLRRTINDLERRLLRDAEENHKKLDKNRWAPNLDTLSWLLVDRVYMGAFAEPGGPLNVLEYLLSMLQLANIDGRVEDAIPVAKSMLFTRNGGRQAEAYVQSLLKNTNRMLMFCFLPQLISNPMEEEAVSSNGKKISNFSSGSEITVEGVLKGSDRSSGDIGVSYQVFLEKAAVLQLLLANRKLIFCTINVDLDLVCALCINLFPMSLDNEQSNKTLVFEVWKALLTHRNSALEDVLITRGTQGGVLMDALHGGFDLLLTAGIPEFYTWLEENWATVQRVLEQRASTVWRDYVSGASRFPAVRIKTMEARRLREMSRRTKERSKMDTRHWEQMLERRVALELVREAMAAELRVLRQDKYGWILHAESGWADHLQQLVHERAIWPIIPEVCPEEPEWQLCPTEGPYRMRKKLERRKKKLGILGKSQLMEERQREGMDKGTPTNLISPATENPLHDQYVDLFSSDSQKRLGYPSKEFLASFVEEIGESKADVGDEEEDLLSARIDDSFAASSESQEVKASSVASLKLAGEEVADLVIGSPQGSVSPLAQETIREEANYLEHEMHEDGEYLIRPHLEPGERIRFRYNCERVTGLDKRDGIFLIGEKCLYVIENYIIDENKCIKEKGEEKDLSIIDRALGVKSNTSGGADTHNSKQDEAADDWPGGRAWAYGGGAWGKEKLKAGQNMPHAWRMWKLESVHELLKRRYQLRPVAIELFSMDGCNDLLVFHKNERDDVFKNLLAMNLPRNSMLDTTISAASKQEASEGGRLFKMMAKSFSKRWQNGEISNFQYLMHLNTLAGRGYNDLTQYPVFPWILKDYSSEELDLSNPDTFRRLDKPMGALHPEREKEFRKRYETWEDPEIPRFHYGSHYSSAGSVLFYLIRLPPFSQENKQLQGGDFDHSDRLFNSIKDTWLSASQGNTADVKELIPEFFYLPEFLENRFAFDFGVKQSGERVNDVLLPPWAKGSAREFVRKHREALESQYVSENLHHWIDLIFGFKQRGKPAVEALNVFYHLTYEGAVDIDRVPDPSMKAAVLAQINHFGQTPKLLFTKPHPKRKWVQKQPLALALRNYHLLAPQEMRPVGSMVSQIVIFQDKVYAAGANRILKPPTYSKYLSWGFSDRSLRIVSYEQEKLLSTHENLHDDGPVLCAGFSRDGRTLVTGGEDGVVSVWRQRKDGLRGQRRLHLRRALCAHTDAVICLAVSQPYSLIVSGSKDRTVIFWDMSSLEYVRQLPELPEPPTAIHANDMTGEVVTASGTTLSVWSINGDCLAAVNTSHLAADTILSITSPHLSDWMEASWYVTGHQNGSIRLWHMELDNQSKLDRRASHRISDSWGSQNAGFHDLFKSCITGGPPEYQLVLYKVLTWHKEPVTALSLGNDLKQLCSGDAGGHLVSWTLPDDGFKQTPSLEIEPDQCTTCQKELNEVTEKKHHCRNCGQISCADCCNNHIVLEDLGYFSPVRVCGGCYESRQSSTGRQLTFSRTASEVCRFTSPSENARNGSELAFELMNALKSASATIAESSSKTSLE